MNAPSLILASFAELLPGACSRETSADPDGWSEQNPLWGHCAVVALAAQSLFGGELLRASLKEFPLFAHMGSHYLNRLPNGNEHDFTRSQFGDNPPQGLVTEERTRTYVLSHPATAERYQRLALRLVFCASGTESVGHLARPLK